MTFNKTYFMIGIGGIGMSAIALHLIENGASVWGYDKVESPITRMLSDVGVHIMYEPTIEAMPEEVKHKNVEVIYTAAIPKRNPLWQFFDLQGNRMYKRAAFLGKICSDKKTFAIAGTHGKTTTASILTHLFATDNRAFTAFVGGIVKKYNSNYISTGIDFYVVEADEYDRSFLQLFPTHAAITTMDADHMEIYDSLEGIEQGFTAFAKQVKHTLLVSYGLPLSNLTYGFEANASYSIPSFKPHNEGYLFDVVTPEGEEKALYFNQIGKHNLVNALCAISLAHLEGVSFESIRKGLASFPGIERRMNQYQLDDLLLIDDYAHHPVELKAVLKTIKSTYPKRKNGIVFQPHLFSRTRDFMCDFASVLSEFDEVILLDIYPARELPIEGVTSDNLLNLITNPNKKKVQKVDLLSAIEESKADLLVMAGAGDIGLEVQKILMQLNPTT